jgi:hypothetical protein
MCEIHHAAAVQASKRLASDDFIVGEGTLSELDSSSSEEEEGVATESETEQEQESEAIGEEDDLEGLLDSILSRWVVRALEGYLSTSVS